MAEMLQAVESISGECLAELGHLLGISLLFFAAHPVAAVPAALLAMGIQRTLRGS